MDQETCCYKERYPQSVVKNEIQEKPESEEKSFTIQFGTGNQSNNNILKEPNRSINNPSNNSEVISKENRKRDLGEENDNVLDDQLSLNKSNDKDIEKSLQGKKKEKKSNSANNKQSADKILKCLETLANKAGKPTEGDSDSVTNSLTLDKSQNTVQQQQVAAAQSNAPFQLSQEQLQQIQQQYQIQSFATSGALQVKQEYNPNIEQQLTTADINKQLVDSNQQQLQSMQILTEPAPQSPHQQATNNQLSMAQQQTAATLNTMSPLQASQVSTDWSQGRIQVLPQSLPGSYLYPHVLMPGNILHSGIGQGMQVIATGKSFQSNQLTPQMLTTAQGKQVIGNATGGFTGAYATLPGIPSSQSQTLLFSPVNVNLQPQHQQQQQQQNLTLPTMAVATNQAAKQNNQIDLQKTLAGQKVLQKVSSSGTLNTNQNITTQQAGQQCAQVSQAMPTAQIISPIQATQQMQFAATPWVQQVPQFWTTSGGISQSALLAPNSIFIRGTQPDGSQGMFIQQNTQNTQQTIQAQPQQNQTVVSIANQVSAVAAKTQRPAHENLAPKPQARTASILPQTLPVFRAAAASSVSTQTAQNQTLLNSKGQKIRNKQQTVRPGVPTIKTDGLGQAKAMQVVTSGGNKMVLMSNGQPINLNGAAMVSIQAAANQNQNQQEKQQQMFQQQLKQQQQQQIMQHQLLMQQNANQQLLQQHLAQQQQIQQLQHPVQVQTQSQTTTNGQQQTNQFIQTQPTQQQTGMVQQIVVQQQGHIPHITMSNAAMNQAIQQNSIQQQTVNIQPKPSIIIAQQQPQQQIQILQNSQHSNNQVVENRVSVASSTSTPSQTIATSAGPLSSPIQLPLQPPQNPLMAMSSLSTGTFTLPVVVSSSSSESSKLTSSVTSSGLSTNVPTSTATTTVATSKDETPKKADITMNGTDFESNVKDRSTPISNGEKCESTTTDISANKENISDTKLNKNESSNKEDVKQNGVTLTNGLTNGINSDNKNDKELPKALIKPNVLTHVIEGYVIHEGTEPFPVTRQRYLEPDSDEPAQKRNCLENDISQDEIKSSDMVACVRCGKEEHKSKLKKKKYCSATCARASREELSLESNGTNDEDNHKKSMNGTAMDISENVLPNSTMDITENGVGEGQYSISYIANLPDPSAVIGKWTVNDVHDFLKAEPTLSDYAEDFVSQEIDGQALLLLNENHLVSVLGMKLGPAVKVIAKIEALKGTPATNGQEV